MVSFPRPSMRTLLTIRFQIMMAMVWFDALATGGVIQGNTVTNNTKDGIRCEYSHYCTISNNVLRNNDEKSGVCAFNSREITVTDSDHASVTGNAITSNCAGITLGGYQRNEYIVAVDNVVTDNSITYSGSAVISNRIGALDKTVPSLLFNPANNNYFDYNSYHFESTSLLNLKQLDVGRLRFFD